MRSLIILLSFTGLLLFNAGSLKAQQLNRNVPAPSPNDEKLPAPPDNPNRLFYVQRSPNANTIVYDLDEKNGKLDPEAPIHPYWVRLSAKGEHEELNYIQRKFAYGLNVKQTGPEQYDVRFVSYKKFPLTLMKGREISHFRNNRPKTNDTKPYLCENCRWIVLVA